jgi:hypothetical protein
MCIICDFKATGASPEAIAIVTGLAAQIDSLTKIIEMLAEGKQPSNLHLKMTLGCAEALLSNEPEAFEVRALMFTPKDHPDAKENLQKLVALLTDDTARTLNPPVKH